MKKTTRASRLSIRFKLRATIYCFYANSITMIKVTAGGTSYLLAVWFTTTGEYFVKLEECRGEQVNLGRNSFVQYLWLYDDTRLERNLRS